MDVHEYQIYEITEDYTVQQDDYVINNVVINNAPTSCTIGEAPKAMATKGDDEAFTFSENWREVSLNDNGSGGTIYSNKYWFSDTDRMNGFPVESKFTAFEEGKHYFYYILAKANENYTFASNVSITLNGEVFTGKYNVSSDGKNLTIGEVPMTLEKPTTQKEIELIEINNATVSFKAGDKPIFTGTVPDDAPYVLDFEGWFGKDYKFITSSDYWNSAYVERDWYDGLITSFKANTEYRYQLYLKLTDEAAAQGYVFGPNTKLKVNGKNVEYSHLSETGDALQIGTELTMTPTAAGASDYKIIEGANVAWTQNTDGTLTFRANGDFSKFTGVKIDGTLIDPKNYTAKSGSTVITLKADYLKTLSVGTHEVTFVYTDGECSTNFEVKQAATPTGGKDTTSPQTGDNSNMALWIALLAVSMFGLAGTAIYSKRKRVR